MATNGSWIIREDLASFLLALSLVNKYPFDQSDWDAIEYGLSLTDEQRDKWFEYELQGQSIIKVRLVMNSEDTYIIHYSLDFEDQLSQTIDFLILMACDFTLIPRHSPLTITGFPHR